jgi:hypothetical protein
LANYCPQLFGGRPAAPDLLSSEVCGTHLLNMCRNLPGDHPSYGFTSGYPHCSENIAKSCFFGILTAGRPPIVLACRHRVGTAKIVIALTLSGLIVFPTTAARSRGAISRELPQVTLFAVFAGLTEASAFPAADLSVEKEQQALILLGCALLLLGIFWLKSTRHATHAVASQKPTSFPAPRSTPPEPEKNPVWIEVELASEPTETCNQAHITV